MSTESESDHTFTTIFDVQDATDPEEIAKQQLALRSARAWSESKPEDWIDRLGVEIAQELRHRIEQQAIFYKKSSLEFVRNAAVQDFILDIYEVFRECGIEVPNVSTPMRRADLIGRLRDALAERRVVKVSKPSVWRRFFGGSR